MSQRVATKLIAICFIWIAVAAGYVIAAALVPSIEPSPFFAASWILGATSYTGITILRSDLHD